MERINYVISEKFVPASIFFALSGSSTVIGKPSHLPPLCPEGYTGRHPNCVREASQEKFSGYNLKGDEPEVANTSDDKSSDWSEKIDADTITAALETAQGLIGLFGKRGLSEVENACGKQPNFLARRARKQQWAQCSSDYIRAKIEASKPKKERGLSTGEWIGIGIGSAALIGMIVAVIATRKKTVVMAQAPVMAAPVRIVK